MRGYSIDSTLQSYTNTTSYMETTQMTANSIERFIKLFLPEGNISQRGKNELRVIDSTLSELLKSIGKEITIEALFGAFQNLSYSISVVEPLLKGEGSAPYIATNSQSICIGVDALSLKKLGLFSKILLKNKIYRSRDSKALAEELRLFGQEGL